MRLLPLERLGARSRGTSPEVFDFRVLLPWVYARDGNRLFVKIIHEKDQFIQDVQPLEFEMDQSEDPDYGALWSAEVEIDPDSGDRHPDSHFGEDGRYVYRYQLESPLLEGPIDWIVDPFARSSASESSQRSPRDMIGTTGTAGAMTRKGGRPLLSTS